MILQKKTYILEFDKNGKPKQSFIGTISKDNAYIDEITIKIPKSILSNSETITSCTAKLYVRGEHDLSDLVYGYPKSTTASFSVDETNSDLVVATFTLGPNATKLNGKYFASVTLMEDTGEDGEDANGDSVDIIAKRSLGGFYYIVEDNQHCDSEVSDEDTETFDTILTNVGTYDSRITANTTSCSTNASNYTTLNTSYTTFVSTTNATLDDLTEMTLDLYTKDTSMDGRVDTLESDNTTNKSDITSLKTRATNLETATTTTLPTKITNDISSHNVSTTCHSDIRTLISNINTRLNTLLDSDDTSLDQLSEFVTYVKANRNYIALKVNISDVKDDLISTDTDKPLSANQGKVLDEKIALNTAKRHEHLNKEILDSTTASFTDSSYVHTDNNFTDTLKAKITTNESAISELDTVLEDIANACEGI